MRVRIGLTPLVPLAALAALASCAALTACTAAPPTGPNANVTAPAVGKPPAPASEEAELAGEAFTPYAGLGAVSDDGLAPGDTYAALHTACMNDAGYGQYAQQASYAIRANRGLTEPQPYGPWGFIGVSLAQQYGFQVPESGPGSEADTGDSGTPLTSLPAGAQAAGGKCLNIVLNFNNAMFNAALAGIETMNNEISNDVVQNAAFKKATAAWSACMTKNGYSSPDADTFFHQELPQVTPGSSQPGSAPASPAPPSTTQIAAAVTDAQCTLTTDLAGIYFAVQGSYEQQFVNANQQALNVAVRNYKAAFARELRKLPQLLRTASATPFSGVPGPAGKPRKASKPSSRPAS